MNSRESAPHPSASRTVLTFHVQPRAQRTEVVGWHGDAIKIRLAAPPVDGAANSTLLAFVANVLGVPRAAVHLVSGAAARRKRVAVIGPSLREAHRALGVE
jgi:uncharacterized protein (TIGR00251 family)